MLSKSTARIRRARVLICLAAVSSLGALFTRSGVQPAQAEQPPAAARTAPAVAPAPSIAPPEPAPRSPLWLQSEDKKQIPILAYPPSTSRAAPLMVMLHGMCDVPQNECPSFAVPSTSANWLVCPMANLQCDGGGTIWSGDLRIRSTLVDSTVERMRASFPGRLDDQAAATLVGFSLGSFVALDVAQHAQGQWKNLLLIGAKIEPDARLLKQAGVQNVLLASGERDMMKWHMVGVASQLQRKGVRATYMSMGNVGHWFADDMDGWLARAMQWFAEQEQAGG
jgi:predicted esterase